MEKIDGLAIDFYRKDVDYHGNIAIVFDELPKQKTFTFAVTKPFDEKHKRYFIKADIFQKQKFEYFEDNIEDFVSQALEQYKAWSRYNIIYLGITVDMHGNT